MRIRPWPRRSDRKAAVEDAREEFISTVREGHAVAVAVSRIRDARENNHFRERFAEALKGI